MKEGWYDVVTTVRTRQFFHRMEQVDQHVERIQFELELQLPKPVSVELVAVTPTPEEG